MSLKIRNLAASVLAVLSGETEHRLDPLSTEAHEPHVKLVSSTAVTEIPERAVEDASAFELENLSDKTLVARIGPAEGAEPGGGSDVDIAPGATITVRGHHQVAVQVKPDPKPAD